MHISSAKNSERTVYKMKIAVLGATGPTGLKVIAYALDRGYDVKALVRNPDKITTEHDRLVVQKVDIFSEEELSQHFTGCDAILSSLGCRPSLFGMSRITFYTDSIKSIVLGMRKSKTSRLVCVTAWNTKAEPTGSWFFDWIIRPVFLGSVLHNMLEMEEYLADSHTDIQYTVVKPPGLTNQESTGKEIISVDGQTIPEISRRISRCDLAKFMLDCIEKEETVHRQIAIGMAN